MMARGRLQKGARNSSVFLNYPFDKDYEPLRDALILAVVACGCLPRGAVEHEGVSKLRFFRIHDSLVASRFSIHDLSRDSGSGQVARFNMPFELGVAVAMSLQPYPSGGVSHDWWAIGAQKNRLRRAVSDLAGFDIPIHRNRPSTLITEVVTWLRDRLAQDTGKPVKRTSKKTGSPSVAHEHILRLNRLDVGHIHRAFGPYQQALKKERRTKKKITWYDRVRIANEIVEQFVTPSHES